MAAVEIAEERVRAPDVIGGGTCRAATSRAAFSGTHVPRLPVAMVNVPPALRGRIPRSARNPTYPTFHAPPRVDYGKHTRPNTHAPSNQSRPRAGSSTLA